MIIKEYTNDNGGEGEDEIFPYLYRYYKDINSNFLDFKVAEEKVNEQHKTENGKFLENNINVYEKGDDFDVDFNKRAWGIGESHINFSITEENLDNVTEAEYKKEIKPMHVKENNYDNNCFYDISICVFNYIIYGLGLLTAIGIIVQIFS